jgi:hypothetical protein
MGALHLPGVTRLFTQEGFRDYEAELLARYRRLLADPETAVLLAGTEEPDPVKVAVLWTHARWIYPEDYPAESIAQTESETSRAAMEARTATGKWLTGLNCMP